MNGWQIDLPKRIVFTDEQLRDLIRRSQTGDQLARDTLIEGNLRLVASVVSRFQNRGFEMDDLFQIGCIGLVKAIDGFDLNYNVKFSTYAVPKIIGEVKRHIRESGPIHVSRSLKQLASKGIACKDQLATELGRPPLISEIAEKIGVSNEELVSALESVSPVISLHQPVHEDEGKEILLEDQLSSPDQDSSFYLKDLLTRIGEDERRLLLLRFFAEKSQTEVASELGISQAQVSRLEKRILGELRNKI